MKTKRKTFGSFFVRVGTGFLAFWLVLMGAFTLLLGQQRAQLMLSEMENRADFFDGNFGKYLLDSKELGTDDTAQLRRALRWQSFRIDSKDPPNVQIVETAITDKNGDVLQSNRWWLTVRDGDTDYDVDMGDQPQKVCEAVLVGSAMTEELRSAPFPEMTFEAWVDGDQAYLKSVTVCQTKEVNGSWEPTGEVNTVECVYDESKVKNLPAENDEVGESPLPGTERFDCKAAGGLPDFSGPAGAARMGREPERREQQRRDRASVAGAPVSADNEILRLCRWRQCHDVVCRGRLPAESVPADSGTRRRDELYSGDALCSHSLLRLAARLAPTGARGAGSPRDDCGARPRAENAALRALGGGRAVRGQPCAGKAGALS